MNLADVARNYHNEINGLNPGNSSPDLSAVENDWSEHLRHAGRHYTPIPGSCKKELIHLQFCDTLGNLIQSSYTKGNSTVWNLSDDNLARTNLIGAHQDEMLNNGTRDIISKISVKQMRNTSPFAVGIKMDGVKINTKTTSRPSLTECPSFIGTKYGQNLIKNYKEQAATMSTGPDFVIGGSTFECGPGELVLYDGGENLAYIASQIQKSGVGQLTEKAIDNTVISKVPLTQGKMGEVPAHWIIKEASPIIDIMTRFPNLVGLDVTKLEGNLARVVKNETGEKMIVVKEKVAEAATNLLKINYRQIPFWDPNGVRFEMNYISNPQINPDNLTDDQLNTVHHIDATVEVMTQNVPIRNPSS